LIIAFTGLKGSGKDTAASIIINKCTWLSLVKFADPLKSMIRALMISRGAEYHETYDYIEGDLKEEPNLFLSGITTRWAMQSLGTEWGRNLMHDNFWIHAAEDRIKELHARNITPVFSDVRFPNEVDFIRRNNGILIKIIRPGLDQPATHPSEQYIKDIKANITIVNDGTIIELEQALLRELHEWL
jgi:hypothetical protein